MPRYAALIEYDGSAYHGFQRQREGEPTVQGELEKAIKLLAQENITITGAGRTDSGVHALGQVIAFPTEWRHEALALLKALNVHLPDDIVILKIEEVPTQFHPRFSARRRTYRYQIINEERRRPLYRRYWWQVRKRLNITWMNRAAHHLLGSHDFATFGNAPQGDNTVRQLFKADWQRHGPELTFEIQANAFLYRMVRSLVGSLRLVGDGTWTVEEFVTAFEACERKWSGATAPAHGLYLTSVMYEEALFD